MCLTIELMKKSQSYDANESETRVSVFSYLTHPK